MLWPDAGWRKHVQIGPVVALISIISPFLSTLWVMALGTRTNWVYLLIDSVRCMVEGLG